MADIKISDLSVGDWIATESAQLTIEGNDITTAFVDKIKKPIQIVSVLGAEQLVFGRIEGLDGFTTIYLKAEHIEPIPLTPEILEKNGLEYEDDGNDAVIFLCCDMFWARLCVGDTFWQVGIHSEDRLDAVVCNVKHTHQLQHALRLAGVEKEIVL